MAKKPSIKTFSKCFNEMKRLSGDAISDDKINQFLDEIKIKQNEDKFNQNQNRTEELLANEIFDKFEFEQALKKRNIAESNIKALDQYSKIVDAVALSEGKIDAELGAKALLVGIQEFSSIARNSIGAKQDTIEVVEITRMYQAINKLGDDAWEQFTSGVFDLELKKAMAGETVEVGMVGEIAKILKTSQAEWRERLNDLGANIGELDDWITKTTHNTEFMANASKRSKIVGDNRFAWREYIKERLNLQRTFAGVTEPAKIEGILDDIYNSLMANDHLKHGGTNSIYGTRNVTNRLNASRVLHFKNAEARHEYDKLFGEATLKESVLANLSSSSRNISLMQELGINPQATFEKTLALLRKKYKSENPELVKKLNFENFKNEFAEIDGSINGIGNATSAKIGMTVRALQSMGKLGFATITSFGDLAQYMSTSNFQGRGFLSGFREALNALFQTQDKAAMSVLGIQANHVVGASFQSNKFGANNDTWGTLGKMQNMYFKWNSLNKWISSLKSGMTVGLAHHYGMLADTKFIDINIRERNLLKLYGIDEGKWDMLRSIKTLDVENRRYLTAEGANELSDDLVVNYLKTKTALNIFKKPSQREIRNFKRDLEITWRNVLVDQAMHGTPEPDSSVRAFMNQGQKKGTGLGETLRFMGQFKSFPITIWKKIINRERKSYGPDDNPTRSSITGLTSLVILSTIFGYIAMSTKDMLRGRSPRDPEKLEVLTQALVQGGGLGIYGDFIIGELQNEYGNSVWDSVAGPTAGDITKLISMTKRIMEGDALKTGKKFQQFAEGNIPFLNMYYSKAAYDYLIGYQIKEFTDPGFFERMEAKHEETRGQSYFLKP